MINPAPYNAEAPPEALAGEITPTELHYVRSNFAVPDHDGVLEVGGAVENPLAPDPRRPARAADRSSAPSPSSAPATGVWRCGRCRPASPGATTPSRPPAGPAPCCTRSWRRRARAADGVDVRFEGADHGAYHLSPILPETSQDDLTFVRSLPLAQAADPAAEILIAYEMNGEPLRPDHGAPFRLVVPHWYAVASVKWLTRIDVLTEPYTGEFQTGHYIYEWPDRPPEPVDLMRVRARITDPAAARGHRRRHLHRARQGLVGHRTGDPGRGQPHRRRRLASGRARAAPGPVPVAGLVASTGTPPTWAGTPCAPERPTRPATCSPTSRRGTGSATGTTPSRCIYVDVR